MIIKVFIYQIIAILCFNMSVFAQSTTNNSAKKNLLNNGTQSFKRETNILADSLFSNYRFKTTTIGVGIPADYIQKSDFITTQVPHLFVSLQRELQFSEAIKGKVVFDHLLGAASYKWLNSFGVSAGTIVLINAGFRISYIHPLNEKISPYVGWGSIYSQPISLANDQFEDIPETASGQLTSELFAGIRYHLYPKTDLFAELGAGFLNLKVGVVFQKN